MGQQTVQVLADLFEKLMGSFTITSAMMAGFDLGDFYSARILGVTDYELTIVGYLEHQCAVISGRSQHLACWNKRTPIKYLPTSKNTEVGSKRH